MNVIMWSLSVLHTVMHYCKLIVQFHRSITEHSAILLSDTLPDSLLGLFCSLLSRLLPITPADPPVSPFPSMALPVDHALNLNQSRANCSSSPSAVISPAEGVFLSQALSLWERSVTVGEAKRGEKVAEERTQDKRAWIPVEWLAKWILRHLALGLFCELIHLWSLSQVEESRWRLTQTPQSRSSWMKRSWRGSRGRSWRSSRPQAATLDRRGPSSSSPSKIPSVKPAST